MVDINGRFNDPVSWIQADTQCWKSAVIDLVGEYFGIWKSYVEYFWIINQGCIEVETGGHDW